MTMHAQVAQIIIEAVELEDQTPESFPYGAPLFDSHEGGGLGFDSIASLEIVTRLGEHFQLDFEDVQKQDLRSVDTLVAYIQARRAEAGVG